MDGSVSPGRQPAIGATPLKQVSAAVCSNVVVIGATNRPDALDPALRRPGRFDREVSVGVPGPLQRAAILQVHTRQLRLSEEVHLPTVAADCNGFTGADLAALCREAAMAAMYEGRLANTEGAACKEHASASSEADPDSADSLRPAALPPVAARHFEEARRRVGASLLRGSAVELPPVAWHDIGGLAAVKRQLRRAVEWPLTRPGDFERLGVRPPRGVLLYGPPGCCKTVLAHAAATAARATVIPLSGAQVSFSDWKSQGALLTAACDLSVSCTKPFAPRLSLLLATLHSAGV